MYHPLKDWLYIRCLFHLKDFNAWCLYNLIKAITHNAMSDCILANFVRTMSTSTLLASKYYALDHKMVSIAIQYTYYSTSSLVAFMR